MKKCPDCGMVIANQAIRCPKCKFDFAEDTGSSSAESAPSASVSTSSSSSSGGSSKARDGIMPMVEVTKDNVNEYYSQLKNAIIKRKTEFDHFIDFLENRTSWLTSPADTTGPLACEKGLLIRSVAVTKQLLRIKDTLMPQLDEESAIIMGLFHDVGKVGVEGKPLYLVEEKPTTTSALGLTSLSRVSSSASTKDTYTINHKLASMNVGARSLFLVSQYMLLSEDEAQAICYAADPKKLDGKLAPNGLVLSTAINMQKNIYESREIIESYSFTTIK